MCKTKNLTIVEFFDGVTVTNMASAMAIKPDKIVFIGERKLIDEQKNNYARFAKEYGIDNVEFDSKSINRNSIKQIISVLEEIVETEENCIFDLTGGEDLVLVAMGMVFEKYRHIKPNKVKMHSFNIKTGAIYDCDSDGYVPEIEKPKLTVKNNIILYGGTLTSHDDNIKGTHPIATDEKTEIALEKLWGMCKQNPKKWNDIIATLATANKMDGKRLFDLDFVMNKDSVKNNMPQNKEYAWSKSVGKFLFENNIITNYSEDNTYVRFKFKNERIKLCFAKEGTLLEQIVLLYARRTKNKNEPMFDDAASGVCIDWDDVIHSADDEERDTYNEIDVVLTKGLIPIFISCKNGSTDENELYKLNTVAERFGGPYAKKVLISINLDNNGNKDCRNLIQRAEDMGIKIIKYAGRFDESEFKQALKQIVD